MPLHKAFGVDLGSSMVKIYSQSQDTIITEKNDDCRSATRIRFWLWEMTHMRFLKKILLMCL